MKYFIKNKNYIYILFLIIICFIMYWLNMSEYTFIDTDETKFVSIAKDMLNRSDWLNLKLNGENWFEYPPLIFWIINFSCFIFGKITLETVRMPISVISLFTVIMFFLAIRSILTKTYALIISLIFSVSLGILIFSRLATNDMLFVANAMLAVLSSNIILFTKKNKTLYWIFVYIFSSLAFLTGGLFGLILPISCITAVYIFSGNLKEIFKIKNIIIGIFIISLITLPWHILMTYKHGINFIKEYLAIYNFTKYTGLKECFKVLLIFLTGFLPWSFSFLWLIGSRVKIIYNSIISYFKENSQEKLNEKWKKLNRKEKFLSINTIIFFTSLIISILWGSKFTFLILFLMFPSSCIAGIYWYDYMIKKSHAKSIFFATLIPNLILIVCSLLGLFGHNFINQMIMQDLNKLLIPLIIIFFAIPVVGIFAVILKGRKAAFCSNIILMFSLSLVLTPGFFNIMTVNSGENDLITFADYANQDKAELTAFIPSKKYSITYYYDNIVKFHNNNDFQWLKKYLIENPQAYVITEIKTLWDIEDNKIPYMLLDSGKRYCLIQYMPYEIKKLEETKEPDITIL